MENDATPQPIAVDLAGQGEREVIAAPPLPDGAPPPKRSLGKRIKRKIKTYRLRRRRAGASKKKGISRKGVYVLSVILLGLFSAYWSTLKYLEPEEEGVKLSFSQLNYLAENKRIATAEFLDEDNLLTGTISAEPVEPLKKKDADKKDDKKDAKGEDSKAKGEPKDDAGDTEKGGGGGAAGKDEGKKGSDKDVKEEVDPKDKSPEEPIAPDGTYEYFLSYPESDAAFGALSDLVISAGAEVGIDPQETKEDVRTVQTYLLPLLILATFFGLLFTAGRGGGSGIGEVMTFGSIGKKRQKRGFVTPTTYADVAGADEAVAEMREVVDYLKDPERYEELGAVPPKGVLLFGPPGCGKTLIARATAGEAEVPFFNVAGAEFVESLVGVGAARVRDLFQRVRAVAPAIVFIDELDAAGRKRGAGGGSGGSDEREQTLNQLLVEMDGFETSAGIVVVGATNRPDILDPALLRPGRFDRHITVEQPDHQGRKLILELHARGKPVASAVDFDYLARRTPGFSGADLANVINEGALLTIREKKKAVETPELEEAIQRVLHGPKRRGRVLSDEERDRASYHESGHAIMAAATGRAEDIHRVTILARGRGLGLTGVQRDTEALLMTRNQLYGQLVTAMAGLASEELMFGEPSTGAEQDLEQATEMALDIVGRFGMSPRLGRARLLSSDADQFLSGDTGISKLSEQTHEAMDGEVRRLLHAAEEEAKRLLGENRPLLDAMAETLKDKETLEGKGLDHFLHQVKEAGILPGPFLSVDGNGSLSHSKARAPRPTQ